MDVTVCVKDPVCRFFRAALSRSEMELFLFEGKSPQREPRMYVCMFCMYVLLPSFEGVLHLGMRDIFRTRRSKKDKRANHLIREERQSQSSQPARQPRRQGQGAGHDFIRVLHVHYMSRHNPASWERCMFICTPYQPNAPERIAYDCRKGTNKEKKKNKPRTPQVGPSDCAGAV